MSLPDAPPAKEPSRATVPPHCHRPSRCPPVAPPTGTFILQLFLIPLLIVTIVVVLWAVIQLDCPHGARQRGATSPKPSSATIPRVGSGPMSWPICCTVPIPSTPSLRHDAALAKVLATFLDRDLKQSLERQDGPLQFARETGTYSGNQAPQGSDRRSRIMRRMYLCRSLGSFAVQEGLPVLLKAARQENDPVEVQVRFSALEALSTLADNCGPQSLQDNQEVIDVLLDASREADDGAPPPPLATGDEPTLYRPHAELRAVAAYSLGVIGGQQATERLEQMLHDTYPNARYKRGNRPGPPRQRPVRGRPL